MVLMALLEWKVSEININLLDMFKMVMVYNPENVKKMLLKKMLLNHFKVCIQYFYTFHLFSRYLDFFFCWSRPNLKEKLIEDKL